MGTDVGLGTRTQFRNCGGVSESSSVQLWTFTVHWLFILAFISLSYFLASLCSQYRACNVFY